MLPTYAIRLASTIQHQILIFTTCLIPLGVNATDCPVFHLQPGDKDIPAFRSLRVPASCDKAKLVTCPGGKIAVNSGGEWNDTVNVAIRCFKPDDKDIENYLPGRKNLDITVEVEEGKKTAYEDAKKSEAKLRETALKKGVPPVVFDRAFANYLELLKSGKTKRGCFMAVDLTTPDQGQAWTLCSGTPPSIKQETTFWGSGLGKDCDFNPANNNNQRCASSFGNKPRYCFSAGGKYITGEVQKNTGVTRQFASLIGLEKGDNDNTEERHVGIHQTSTDNGMKDYVGNVPPYDYSNGCITLPFRGNFPTAPDMTEFSSRQPQGGLAVYVYPAKSDIIKFRNRGYADYWNAECAEMIGQPAWYGTKETYGIVYTDLDSKPRTQRQARRPAAQ